MLRHQHASAHHDTWTVRIQGPSCKGHHDTWTVRIQGQSCKGRGGSRVEVDQILAGSTGEKLEADC